MKVRLEAGDLEDRVIWEAKLGKLVGETVREWERYGWEVGIRWGNFGYR